MIFQAYVDWLGYDQAVTIFFYLKVVVYWDTTPEDHSLPDGGRVNVVLFGRITCTTLISGENPLARESNL